MITSSGLPTHDAKSLAFLESVQAVTSLHGFDSGMLPWLARFRRILHFDLTAALPDRIQRAWEQNDLAAFADALDEFEKAFTEAVAIYRHWKEAENA